MEITFHAIRSGDAFPGIEIVTKRRNTVRAIYTCCGKMLDVSERTLMRRLTRNIAVCRECAKRGKTHADMILADDDEAPLEPAPARFLGVYFEPGQHGKHWWASLSSSRESRQPRHGDRASNATTGEAV